jgi:hypothetical protein
MDEIRLCLFLLDSLNAAYRREIYPGPEWLAGWGHAVIRLMRRAFPDQKELQEALWHSASRALWDLACAHSADGLLQHFLHRPEAFVRAILMVWAHDPLWPNELRCDPSKLN